MKKFSMIATVAALGILTPAVSLYAKPTTNVTPEERTKIENVVSDYLEKNPEVIIHALQSYQQKQMEQAQDAMKKTQATSPKFSDALFRQAHDPIAGNPNGKITVVEFFDYQCPHCIAMTEIIDNLVKSNPNIRVIFKEFPIRGQMSEISAKAALAANQQGKYFEFHKGLMNSKVEPLTENEIYKIAASAGLNVDQLKKDMDSATVTNQIKANYKLAQDLNLMGTPAFFVGKTDTKKEAGANAIVFIPGQVDQAQMNDIIKKMS